MATPTMHPPRRMSVIDATASTAIFWVGFVVLLVIALVAQILAMNWRSWLPGAEGESSLIGAVKAAVYTFMSNIP
jgi:light-harvesting complex 1 beta chain